MLIVNINMLTKATILLVNDALNMAGRDNMLFLTKFTRQRSFNMYTKHSVSSLLEMAYPLHKRHQELIRDLLDPRCDAFCKGLDFSEVIMAQCLVPEF
uniref:Uncharacterized protein n=1 Tax=Helianthus annuus TaxID=4232 RepID=A0A251SAT3_HELAN